MKIAISKICTGAIHKLPLQYINFFYAKYVDREFSLHFLS